MSDDEDGMESFEVNDTDLEYALNPGRRHFQSKNQATYGVWADREDSDDENDGAIGFKKGGRGQRSKKDYSAPVSFVSGGIKQGSSLDPPKTEVNEEAALYETKPRAPKKQRTAGANVMAGMRTSAVRSTVDPTKFADWAKYGNESVMKMMKAMGYKMGSGLGVNEQGIVEPVTAKVRAGRGAVGAYGKEATGPKFGESAADAQRRMTGNDGGSGDSGVAPRTANIPKGGWKKAGAVKTRYKTIEDVIQEGGSIGHRASVKTGVKVIDMTGPEQRVYSGYDSFSMKTKADVEDGERDVFDVPELRHNLNLLLDMTEESIRRNATQLRTLTDQTTALEYDLGQIKTVLSKEEKEAERMQEVYSLIEKFTIRTGENAPSMNEYQQLFLTLRSDYSEEYRIFNLEAVVIPCVLPQLREYFSAWHPLDPLHLIYGIDLMKEWREILVVSEDNSMFTSHIRSFDEMSAYDRLLWEGWLPSLRSAVIQEWQPKTQVEEMRQIIELWLPILPAWMKEHVLEKVIIPRMARSVEEWNPLTDPIPVHSWIICWLDIMGDRLQPIMTTVRQKLGEALRKWTDAEDSSAMLILKPWKGVWTPPTMAGFLARHVVPKLERCLDRMVVDPRLVPNYKAWSAVVAWLELICPDTIANIITKYFFPRWFDMLCDLLDSANGNYTEVTDWFTQWKARIPAAIYDYPTIKENLRRAMVALAQSRQGMRVSAPPPPPVMEAPPPPPPPSQQPRARLPPQSLSLKDVIEMTAARHDLTYVPQKDRLKDGRQVFWFGPLSIYMDGGMVYLMDPVEFMWRPAALDELLRMAGVEGM